MPEQMIFKSSPNIAKVSRRLGVVFGYAIVCEKDGEPYYDLQGDHIPEEVMLKASCEFMDGDRIMKDMHEGEPVGKVLFAFPMTKEIAESLGVSITQTGLLAALKPNDPAILDKFDRGEYTGFSIGGYVVG